MSKVFQQLSSDDLISKPSSRFDYKTRWKQNNSDQVRIVEKTSGGELLELRLLDTHLLDTFGSKSIARHKFYHLLESS